MRVNEYQTLEAFTSEYNGVWAPSDGHWFGLEFSYKGQDYRLHTGQMFLEDPDYTDDGREVLFGLYAMKGKKSCKDTEFVRMASFASMEDLLKYTGIDNRPFREVIMDDDTKLTGKD